ncbi:hypothetical protein [Pseudomonas fluorescens]|uniref:hypothetical protein n=1 Tax=Pseudomonas fluorescens TaxID=294 RepID=UPI0007D09A9E|nr:hypothetical protein [Pseudomonas fluorescens]
MNKIIRTIALGFVVQIAVATGLTVWLFNHNNDMALQYSQLAERNANAYTDEALRLRYNQLQLERSQERESLHTWIDKRIDLKLSQLPKEHKQ